MMTKGEKTMKKPLSRPQFLAVSIVGLLLLLAVGICAKALPNPVGYLLLRDGCYWPFIAAKIVWCVAVLGWLVWSCWTWRKLTRPK